MPTLNSLVLATIVAAILGGAKLLMPIAQKSVPGFLWPVLALVLGYFGTQACTAIGATCSGNPLDWTTANDPNVSAAAAALLAIVIREVTKHLRDHGVALPNADAVSPLR